MRKNTISTILLGLLVLMSSCDSFLDIKPVGKVIPTTADEFRALIAEAYATVSDDRGLASFRSDEMLMDGTMAANDLNSYKDIWIWNDYAASENTATFKWRQFYHVLFIANYVIESESMIENGTSEEIRQMVGEAYMLRAYMHFILVNLHAPAYTKCDPAATKAVPLKLDSDTENTLSRNTVAEVYASILDDLELAEDYLNVDSWETGLNYRFTTLSVDAIRSRVCLYMGDWSGAYKAAQSVLAVKSELADVAKMLPSDYRSVESIVSLEEVMSAQYARAMKVAPAFFKMYGTGDLRKNKYYKQITASKVDLLKGGSNQYSCTVRVGEMYLNAAEAALQGGTENGLDEARTQLLTLQQARYNASAYAAKMKSVNEMTSEDLLQEIYDERARELAFEGHRWFDLRRTTQPRIVKTFKGEEYVLEEGDERYTIRIPAEAIEANPNLAN